MTNSTLTENFNSDIYSEENNLKSLDIFEKTNLFKAERATRSKTEKLIRNDIKGWLFSCWPFIGWLIFAALPFGLSIYLSMCDLHVFNLWSARWVGFDNYIYLMFSSESQFWWSLFQSFYMCLELPIGIFMGIGSAMLLTSRIKLKRLFRTILYIPSVCSSVGVVMMWQVIFDTDHGLINSIIASLGGEKVMWFTTPELFMPMIIFTSTWGSGNSSIMFQAAFTNINKSLIEAAEIDGANKWQIFKNITLPAISPSTFYVLTMSIIAIFQDMGKAQLFAQVGNVSGYGPKYGTGPFKGMYAGMTATYYIYMMGFGGGSEGQGKSSAAAWMLALVIIAMTRINFKLADLWVNYD